ncbi:MAG: hypothetical protein NWQ54_01175 [Paraglaciecola sp.]|uniref:hypothetical protein n=1 Tax=Paraglaciecola sp. TaxID=1920173 RepID=UPI00273D502A|nr:hypothetical protein [Paraglaciecola sp.]MDP5031946.1 hypothetical protein [Paraglaciecola sp.]MDP5039423.1 hypothetical protein [Paraglaciecola sp.]MDP5129463.1 hypothetical protein [Paraglaciecola sp.]
MQTDKVLLFQNEWQTLQNQSDSYEKLSLLIKLVSITLSCLLWFSLHAGLWALVIIAILWLQDAIWCTFQNRIAQRLLVVEEAIHQNICGDYQANLLPFQFNQSWLASRPSGKALVGEYIHQGLRPTVAYPHIMLIFMCIALCMVGVN